MSPRQSKDLAASIHQRLLNKARETNRPFNELLQYFAMERFLYRLSKSNHVNKFILKGALMLRIWDAPLSRPTKDIDLLGETENDIQAIINLIREICLTDVNPDGISLEPDSIMGEPIREDADYEGVRVRIRGTLGTAKIILQLDIAFGDVVIPSVARASLPTILDLPAPEIQVYSRESTIAEKFEAMVKLGLLNSRMNDFFDIWLLSRRFNFDGRTLSEAIRETFRRRHTDLPTKPTAFTKPSYTDTTKTAQWRAFVTKNRIDNVPLEFEVIVKAIAIFIEPIIVHLSANKSFYDSWKAPGPWRAQ